MKKKTILITGDDGYHSLGTRVLIHFLKNDFDLSIVCTKKQQSGVGGYKSIQLSGTWGKEIVDGTQALWIDGSPVDAMELAKEIFPHPFDYIISGINWGANIGGCLLSSGTFSAAAHGVNLGIAKRAIAISWDVPSTFHFQNHSIDDDISKFLDYPGKVAHGVIEKTMSHALWGADIVNINLPQRPTKIVEVVKPLKNIYRLWPPMKVNKTTGSYSYGVRNRTSHLGSKDTDVQVLSRGHISMSPCQSTYLDVKAYDKMVGPCDTDNHR